MDHKNFTLKSWLPQAGTSERTIILKKLKRNLERLGFTRDEVYTGLVQLTESPQVLVKRWRAHVVANEKSKSTTNGPKILSPPKEIERTEIGEDTVPEAKDDAMDDVDDGEKLPSPPRSKTPELLDEEVGGESHLFGKIPRKVIPFNLQAFEAQCVKMNHRRRKFCTVISVADSSVSDHENATSCHIASGNEQKIQKKDNLKTEKPKIVEDWTCLEGTILPKRFKPSRVAINRVDPPENKTVHITEEAKTAIVTATTIFTKGKRRARTVYYWRKKSRVRRRFRQLFGNDLTSSELDEEDSLIERFLGTSRRKKARNSSDSGFSLTELNSEDVCVSQSGSEAQDSSEESTPSSPETTTINDIKEERDETNTSLRSMPLLDASSSTCNSIVEIPAEAVPDGSTNSSENCIVQADSSVVEPSIQKGKITILVSPVDIHSADAFSPVSLEIDIPCENDLSVPTSTTDQFSEVIQKTKESESVRESEVPPNDVEINISNDGECKVVLPPRNTKNDAIVINYLGSETTNEGRTEVNLMITQDVSSQEEKKSLSKGVEKITPVPEPVPEMAVIDQEKPRMSTEGQSGEKEKENINKGAIIQPEIIQPKIIQPEIIQPILPSQSSFPRIRVLLPSELGSRWCPTPVHTTSSCSQNVTSVPSSGSGSVPTRENNHSQGNGVPIVQPVQSFRNIPRCPTPVHTTSSCSQNVTSVPSSGSGSVPIRENNHSQGNGVPIVQPAQSFRNIPRCPTTVHTTSSCSQNVTSVPSSGSGSVPIRENNHSQGNGVPIVQPAQSFRNIPCTTSGINAATMPGTNTTRYENSPNNVNGWQQGCNDPRNGSSGQRLSNEIAKRRSFWTIFQLLHSLNDCIESTKCAYLPDILISLRNQFIADRTLLLREMEILSSLSENHRLIDLLEYIIRTYEENVVESGRITRQQILTIVASDNLPTMCRPPVANYESQIHHSRIASQPQLRPRPPPYPTYPNRAHLPQNSVNPVPQHTPPQPVMLASPNQSISPPRPSPPPAFHSPYFTAQQMNTLIHQIKIYHKLCSKVNLPQARQSVTLPAANSTPQNVPRPVESVPRLPIPYDTASRGLPGVQNIQWPTPTKPVQRRRYARRPSKEINDSRRKVAAVTEDRRTEVTIEDVLWSLASTSEPIIHNRIIDSNNNNNERRIKIQASTRLPNQNASMYSENIERTERIPVAENTMSSVEREMSRLVAEKTMISVEKQVTCPVEKELTCPIEKDTTCPIEAEITSRIEEEAMCLVEEETTSPIEDEMTPRMEEEAMCLVEEETTSPIQEQTMCSVEEQTTCSVEEETACPTEEEYTCSVKEETTCPMEEEEPCPVEEETTCPMEEEEPCPLEEETTCPIEEEMTCPIEEETCPVEEGTKCLVEEDTCLVKEETTCPMEEGTKCSFEEDACPAEEEATCPIEEGTECLFEEQDTCPVEGETTCSIEEEDTCSVEEETTCPIEDGTKCLVEEETTCSVKEETMCPVVEKPHSNNPGENDKSGSFPEYEIIDILDEPETVETDISSGKHVSVIVHNNSKTENSDIEMIEDTESNFSILEVKSITKNIFDNMEMMEEELGDETCPMAAEDVNLDHEDSTTNSDLRNCLQCGEPSSVVCEQCYEAFYCSSECHEAHWTEQHYLTCKPVPVEALAQFEMTSANLPCLEDELSTK